MEVKVTRWEVRTLRPQHIASKEMFLCLWPYLLRGGIRLPWVRVSAALCRASPYSKRK